MRDGLEPFAESVHGAVVKGVRGGDGPTALLLHGTAGSWRNFRPWLPTLQTRCHLVAPDVPGFGDSPAPDLAPTLDAWASLLHELTARMRVTPQILIGLGMGASLALAYLGQAARATLPARVVLHTPAYYPGAIRPAARRAVRLLTSPALFPLIAGLLGHPAVRQQFVHRLIAAPHAVDQEIRMLMEDVQRASLAVLRGLARDMVRVDFRPLLRGLGVPTLALVGEHDPFVRAAEVSRLSSIMQNATVVVQRQVAHGWTESAIREQNALLAEFLARPG